MQAYAGQQVELACKSGRVVGVLQTPDHLVVRDDLARVRTAYFKELAEQRWLVDSSHREDVVLDHRGHNRTEDVVPS